MSGAHLPWRVLPGRFACPSPSELLGSYLLDTKAGHFSVSSLALLSISGEDAS